MLCFVLISDSLNGLGPVVQIGLIELISDSFNGLWPSVLISDSFNFRSIKFYLISDSSYGLRPSVSADRCDESAGINSCWFYCTLSRGLHFESVKVWNFKCESVKVQEFEGFCINSCWLFCTLSRGLHFESLEMGKCESLKVWKFKWESVKIQEFGVFCVNSCWLYRSLSRSFDFESLKIWQFEITAIAIAWSIWEVPSWMKTLNSKARCMYYLGQFEKSLLVWTKADRLRKNNKEVLIAT